MYALARASRQPASVLTSSSGASARKCPLPPAPPLTPPPPAPHHQRGICSTLRQVGGVSGKLFRGPGQALLSDHLFVTRRVAFFNFIFPFCFEASRRRRSSSTRPQQVFGGGGAFARRQGWSVVAVCTIISRHQIGHKKLIQ